MRRALSRALGGLALAGSFLASFLAASLLAGDAVAAGDGDRQAGRQLAGQCRTCHGLDGMARTPIAPHIGGEPADYIVRQLTAFRDGTREHEMMSIIARSLSDRQIADLGAWYAGHTIEVSLDADPAGAPAACTACHGIDGVAVTSGVPNLAGETNIYIDTQLKAFRSGRRVHEVMTPVASAMTDAEIRAAADWYAAVGITIEQVD